MAIIGNHGIIIAAIVATVKRKKSKGQNTFCKIGHNANCTKKISKFCEKYLITPLTKPTDHAKIYCRIK